jgi:murein DD-endopeptidase MepM/ murein hydrolase activator NlpD
VNSQPGFISAATDVINDQVFSASEIVERVSREFSIDPRILLAFLEFRSAWLSQRIIEDELVRDYPLGVTPDFDGVDRHGLYRQLSWAANQLNRGYYGWKYRGLNTVQFSDGDRIQLADDLNAGTVALLFLLSQNADMASWESDISTDGFMSVYRAYFDVPNEYSSSLLPADLVQPEFILPFERDQVWYFTGGPHGGWGSGSAWSAIDFAPPDDRTDADPLCYLSKYWVTAIAPGVIARSEDGVVILDLDFDGDEATGWSILYLHIGSEGRIASGQEVQAGDRIGRASCEGGFSTATHMHIARRYNGEWIPVECEDCSMRFPAIPFLLNGWRVYSIIGQEYQGYLVNDNERRVANQGRQNPSNHIAR